MQSPCMSSSSSTRDSYVMRASIRSSSFRVLPTHGDHICQHAATMHHRVARVLAAFPPLPACSSRTSTGSARLPADRFRRALYRGRSGSPQSTGSHLVFPFILIKMHEKGGNFCIFLLKITEKRRNSRTGRILGQEICPPAVVIVRVRQKL